MTTDITELAQQELAQLRAELSNQAIGSKDHLRKIALSLVDKLEKCRDREIRWLALSDEKSKIITDQEEALEKAQRANAAQDDHINQQQDRIEQLEKGNQYAGKRIAELEPIRAAAEKLVRCKGRYHSEQNYRALAALFGVNTPDLPPIDGESRTVTAESMQESAYRAGLTAGWNLGLSNNNDGFNKCLSAHGAGIKWEAE